MDQSSTNKVILIGRLGQDPEIRLTTNGDSVGNISIATSEKFKKQSAEVIEKTEWHRCVVWRQTADFVKQYIKKGDLVYIEGKLQTRKWQDNSGNNRYTTEIQVRQLTPLGSKKDKSPKKNSDEDDLPDFLKDLDKNNKPSNNEDELAF